jgi:hypothetical protein
MKINNKKKRLEFNIHLNSEDRLVIDELKKNGVNISRIFKNFIRVHLDLIRKINT